MAEKREGRNPFFQGHEKGESYLPPGQGWDRFNARPTARDGFGCFRSGPKSRERKRQEVEEMKKRGGSATVNG